MRSAVKWLRRLLVAAVILVVALPLLWLGCARFDVSLRAEAQACEHPQPQDVPAEANAYYAFIGFYAEDVQADINGVGQGMLAEYLRRLQAEPNLEGFKYRQERQVRGKPTEICEPLRESCLVTSAASRELIEQLVQQNSVLLQRYQSLYRYPQYRETAPPRSSMPFPSYAISLHHLVLARIALQATDGQHAVALTRLAQDTDFWRIVLRDSHYLIGKAVASHAVLDSERMLSDLLGSTAPLRTENQALLERMLHPLSQAERDLDPAKESEFCIFGNGAPIAFFNGVRESRLARTPVIARRVVMAFLTTGFRPNHTQNLLNDYMVGSRSSEHSGTRHFGDSAWDYVYNPIGKYIVYEIAPGAATFSSYRDRLADLDGLIRLTSLQWEIEKRNIRADDIPAFLVTRAMVSGDADARGSIRWDERRRVLWLARFGARPGEAPAFEAPLGGEY